MKPIFQSIVLAAVVCTILGEEVAKEESADTNKVLAALPVSPETFERSKRSPQFFSESLEEYNDDSLEAFYGASSSYEDRSSEEIPAISGKKAGKGRYISSQRQRRRGRGLYKRSRGRSG